MEERDWLILKTLHAEKNITKASEVLYISQPRLSNRLRQIEERFAVQIVIRGKKGVFFTPEGELLAQYAQKMLRELNDVKEKLHVMGNDIKGVLRIGTSSYFAKRKLPDILKRFRIAYPEVEFRVVTNLSGHNVDLLHRQDIDVGFIRGEHNWPYNKEFLFSENVYVVSLDEIALSDLPNIPRIEYTSSKSSPSMLDEWWKENFSVPPMVLMEVDKVAACKEMVLQGLGYAFLSEGIVADAEKLHKILMVGPDGVPLVRRTWMCYHEERLNVPLIRRFVNFVNEAK